ncbi:putative endo-1,4-beta-xylanase [Helianthus annuus]|uniref:Endo-1,4-beta-xylanase n=1 Tax=Helianthus annuus TaxID=4232 RepID=A0A251UU41_HELAN|nr:endo-1,4-beta-xylanase 1 [Helianthus annuus]XP_022039910.1 endo-1,4-beta-xylanase 1 [Helianthus annuus]XP_022039911.1 endo-1,4-beta-xylanase 1 [Helianthus annuus]XP_022039912.1 endo-1,4-beta-xylanase 1 [Helianthus annuus]KAF5807833.1 putative endo-1,4-beta-xylanase [Helianthus annuus]KAJ0571896.1 putative endo-1,4-beta-xylanase [Helianthus annuus]KAJ0579153.1 putative endo-1,4-beta-xylanase [Helianthus annuus]KAJ0924568.1 putative endo-1,4-beta-xylanase [Helianthus annuus]
MASSSSMCNIIHNHDFSNGMHSWHTNCCDGTVVSTDACNRYALISNRKECWQGLEQDITTRVSSGITYTLCARVGVSGTHHAHVIATLKLEYHGSETKYMFITRTSVSKGRWENLEGTFVLSDKPDPDRVVFYLEGPDPGVNLLVQHVLVSSDSTNSTGRYGKDENIILNPNLEEGVNKWSGRGCQIGVHRSMRDGKILPRSGNFFASTTQRAHTWNGIQQDITTRVERKLAYNVIATVRIVGNNSCDAAEIRATMWVKTSDSREQYIGIASTHATDKEWVELQGTFVLNGYPSKVVVYLEGPPPGIDILLDGFVVKRANRIPPSPRPLFQNADFGVNIIANSDLRSGTKGWFPLGNCKLSVAPPSAAGRNTLGSQSGHHSIHATHRTHTWMGPAQLITDKVKLFLTYQVSAWVRLVPGATGSPQNVNVALGVDDQWVNAGQVEVNDDRWHEICGSFRIEKPAGKVMVYVQGPAPEISFMVARFQIFAVDRQARFRQLKHQTDKIRKRGITLKFTTSDSRSMHGATVKIQQLHNSFPIGSCISRTNIDNEDFVAFFLKHFNWAVFGNELKWYWTESQRGNFNYRDADELLKFCEDNNIGVRGHCIFWEVEDTVQNWVKSLGRDDLAVAVQNRLKGLVKRYKGKMKHYDVNNEMLHGSFYQDRLGEDIRAKMFKEAKRLDPSAVLFVNDYHVEDGCDTRSSPEKYIDQIVHLEEQGAPVGGIGIQGHIDSPVGSIVCCALDKLGKTGLPIWFTELDVCSMNEHVRADDLEVMMREAFAHPAVEGIMLWGFWESFMSREKCHLVDAEGQVNEAGKRFIELKKEWLSDGDGYINEQSEFSFRGFEGTYQVIIQNKIVKTFVVQQQQQQQVVVVVYVD